MSTRPSRSAGRYTWERSADGAVGSEFAGASPFGETSASSPRCPLDIRAMPRHSAVCRRLGEQGGAAELGHHEGTVEIAVRVFVTTPAPADLERSMTIREAPRGKR
jgi:hypothetical protein